MKKKNACFDATEYVNVKTGGKYFQIFWPSHNILALQSNFLSRSFEIVEGLYFFLLFLVREADELRILQEFDNSDQKSTISALFISKFPTRKGT